MDIKSLFKDSTFKYFVLIFIGGISGILFPSFVKWILWVAVFLSALGITYKVTVQFK